MNRPEKVIKINEVDERIVAHIRDVLASAIARSLTEKAIKEVCSEQEDM